jgi:hypothetical protein
MILGITGMVIDKNGNRGSAGAGKSTVANRLIDRWSFTAVGMADPMKRFLMDLYDWPAEVLFGETELKNKPDERYPRARHRAKELIQALADAAVDRVRVPPGVLKTALMAEETVEYLTPRLACQKLGKAMRECYPDVWCVKGMRVAKQLLTRAYDYHPVHGLISADDPQLREKMGVGLEDTILPVGGVCFSDIRFKNELAVIKREGGKVIRVVRPVEQLFISNEHESENDLNDVPDEEFDYVLQGPPSGVPIVQALTDKMMENVCQSR